jgi:hypothetical protein
MLKKYYVVLALLFLCSCAALPGQYYVKPGPLQVAIDCSISTFYDDSGTKKTGFSENYNLEVCEAFATAVRQHVRAGGIGEVVEPVTITLGGQFGRDVSTSKIFIGDGIGRLDGVIKLPKFQGKTIPFNTLPQGDLPYRIKKLTETSPYRGQVAEIKHKSTGLMGDFYTVVPALPVAMNFPLVGGAPVMMISIEGQKLSDSLQASGTMRSIAQGVGTAVITGLLTGGSYIGSAWQESGSAIAVNVVMIDEEGKIASNRITGGKLRKDLDKMAKTIFGYIKPPMMDL